MPHLCPQEVSFLLYQLRFGTWLWWQVRRAWARPYRFSPDYVTIETRGRYSHVD